jgi:hypothetical protein
MLVAIINLAAIALMGATLSVARPQGAPAQSDSECAILADAWKAMGGKPTQSDYCVGRSVGPGVSFNKAGNVVKMYVKYLT